MPHRLMTCIRALKYSRLKGRIPEVLAKDSASTIEVSPRVLVSLVSLAGKELMRAGSRDG